MWTATRRRVSSSARGMAHRGTPRACSPRAAVRPSEEGAAQRGRHHAGGHSAEVGDCVPVPAAAHARVSPVPPQADDTPATLWRLSTMAPKAPTRPIVKMPRVPNQRRGPIDAWAGKAQGDDDGPDLREPVGHGEGADGSGSCSSRLEAATAKSIILGLDRAVATGAAEASKTVVSRTTTPLRARVGSSRQLPRSAA